MSFFRTSQWDVPNQSLAEIQKQINVSLESLSSRTGEVEQTLWNSIDHLGNLKPKFISVTYGANSDEYDRTYSIIKGIKDRTGLEAVPHLTYIDTAPIELRIIAYDCWNNGTRHAVVLYGDLPPGSGKPEMCASDLVTLLKKVVDFDISAAAYPEIYPEAKSAQADLLDLRRKVSVKANRAITQFFLDVGNYLRFRDRYVSAGVDVEIVPGTLPASNFKQVKEFAGTASVRIPAWMAQVSDGLDDDTKTRKLVGANIIMDMMKILGHEGVEDFHFYTLSRTEMSYAICYTLGVRPGL